MYKTHFILHYKDKSAIQSGKWMSIVLVHSDFNSMTAILSTTRSF